MSCSCRTAMRSASSSLTCSATRLPSISVAVAISVPSVGRRAGPDPDERVEAEPPPLAGGRGDGSGDPGLDPAVELADVVLAGHQDAAMGVDARAHGRLAALAGVEVLLVDPVEQLHGRIHV